MGKVAFCVWVIDGCDIEGVVGCDELNPEYVWVGVDGCFDGYSVLELFSNEEAYYSGGLWVWFA